MDLGYYLGELLMQQDEVSVPGLGYFTLVRKSSYYAEDEHKFYPPYNQVEFDSQFIEDDALAQYVAQQKNISITSANYFVEKYVTGLKEQALSEKVAIGNLGWFSTENGRLAFQSADKLTNDSHFYGLEPVSVHQLSTDEHIVEDVEAEDITHETPVAEEPIVTEEPVIEEPVAEPIAAKEPVVVTPQIQEEPAYDEYYDHEEEKRSSWRWILITLGILIIVAGTIFGLYYYKPDLFEKFVLMPNKPSVTDTVKHTATDTLIAPDTAKTDTAKKDTTVKKDTIAKDNKTVKTDTKTKVEKPVNTAPVKAATPIVKNTAVAANPTSANTTIVDDAVGTRRFEVIVFTARKEETTNLYIEKLKTLGLKAWLVPDAPGFLKRVSIGHFKTREEARAFGVQQQENGKIRGESYPLEIIPQQ